jgi:hypothetical protein
VKKKRHLGFLYATRDDIDDQNWLRRTLSACLNKQQIISPNLNLTMIFAFCLYQTWLYISGIDHILVWNLRQTIDSRTQTHLHTMQMYFWLIFIPIDLYLYALSLRVFVQNVEFLSRHILARKFKKKNIFLGK